MQKIKYGNEQQCEGDIQNRDDVVGAVGGFNCRGAAHHFTPGFRGNLFQGQSFRFGKNLEPCYRCDFIGFNADAPRQLQARLTKSKFQGDGNQYPR